MTTSGRNVTLRHMRVFMEIVRQGNLQRASQALNITQSAVSKSLRELEQELGVVLLKRGRKGTTLTPAGEAFHEHAAQSLVTFSRAITAARDPGQEREVLRIGALPTVAGSVVPRAVAALKARRRDVGVQIMTGPYEFLAGLLRGGEQDFIVGGMIKRDNVGLSFEPLYEEEIVAVVHAAHPLCAEPAVTALGLSRYPIVVPPEGTTVRGLVDDYFLASGVGIGSDWTEALSDLFSRVYTRDQDAVWLAPRGTVEFDLDQGTLVRLPLHSRLLRVPVGVTFRTDTAFSPLGLAFLELLRGEVRLRVRADALIDDPS
ncbi:LysR substrate-binding domain-containing protein [Halomonas sp. V046]|uniref:LysR substrate-binding domain-containing protein n=1 Tax=Halomonas sp. V046 TaxID=3459611 RepID=UPI004044CD5B